MAGTPHCTMDSFQSAAEAGEPRQAAFTAEEHSKIFISREWGKDEKLWFFWHLVRRKEESELSFFWTLLMKTRCEAPILHSQTPAVRVITAAELLPESSFFLITFWNLVWLEVSCSFLIHMGRIQAIPGLLCNFIIRTKFLQPLRNDVRVKNKYKLLVLILIEL